MSLLPNTVVNGNCLEVMKEIDDASIDMILCDLPYGATQNSWDSVIPPAPLWEQYERIIKPNGAILLFGQDKFTATMMLSNPKKDFLVPCDWLKNQRAVIMPPCPRYESEEEDTDARIKLKAITLPILR